MSCVRPAAVEDEPVAQMFGPVAKAFVASEPEAAPTLPPKNPNAAILMGVPQIANFTPEIEATLTANACGPTYRDQVQLFGFFPGPKGVR